MTINRVEDLEVWKKSIQLCKLIYKLTEKYPPSEKYNIVKHLHECGRNIPGNIAEGFGRFHYQESIQFYRIARGSLNEARSDIYLSKELGYITDLEKEETICLMDEILRMLNGLVLTTKNFKS
jgi:four helix bundle protein